jgi:hypothetical protein
MCAGATVNVGIDPSKVVINKLKMDNDRKNLLERKKVCGAVDGGVGLEGFREMKWRGPA